GAEYQATHDAIRQNLYHAMIDAGVEMVLADHPHWTQDTEAYAGKLIVYSMGNFMFDQTSNKEVSRSAAITTDLKVTNASEVDFAAWDELSTACATLSAQACFEKIQSAKLVAPKYDYHFGYIATTSAENRITRRASDAEQAEMAQRLNWSATMAALGQ
ncbi:CapA family protein, partial [Candidatus Saccharibacteria bacterium]|nr:CapA family protein [Candidatus Saccharibacteria bacterium]